MPPKPKIKIKDNSELREQICKLYEKASQISLAKWSLAMAKHILDIAGIDFNSIEEIVEGAKSKTNKELLVSAESDAQRKKNIRQNRQIEREINREIEAFELDRQLNNKNADIISFNELEEELPSNPLDLLRRKQREAFGKIRE